MERSEGKTTVCGGGEGVGGRGAQPVLLAQNLTLNFDAAPITSIYAARIGVNFSKKEIKSNPFFYVRHKNVWSTIKCPNQERQIHIF